MLNFNEPGLLTLYSSEAKCVSKTGISERGLFAENAADECHPDVSAPG